MTVETQLTEICDAISDIESRLSSIESDVSGLEDVLDQQFDALTARLDEVDKALLWIANKLNGTKPDDPPHSNVVQLREPEK